MVGQTATAEKAMVAERKKYLFSSKTHAVKEIETWGRDYGSLTDPSMRSTGHLTENVTEARMLQSKIMEMSRERYKYITQADFGMKFFLSGQRRKQKLMPQLLHGVDVDYWLSKKPGRHAANISNSPSHSARFALLERLETTGEKCKEFDEENNPFDMPSRPKPPEKQLPEFYRIRLKEQEEAELAKMTFPTQPVLRPQTRKSVTFCAHENRNTDKVKLPNVAQSVKSMPLMKTTTSSATNPTATGQQRRVQSGPVNRSVHDQRYKGLEQSLTDKSYQTVDTEKVQLIIQKQDSLHTPSRHSTANSRPKLQKKILEYLREKGFVCLRRMSQSLLNNRKKIKLLKISK